MHPSYYHQAHACVLVFDVTRKITYKNLSNWLSELRNYRPEIPCFCAANKIDADTEVTNKAFNFAKKNNIPFYFVSAANGTNVVRVFTDAIRAAVAYKENSVDPLDQIMEELEDMEQNHEVKDGESYADPLS
ncbi:Rab-like protein 2A [Taenia crassiceps]|uniref:Rab-like protein 2A n=1 Tax=Taenia crassiceps TaxID=6207 RepID=A0ABR4QFM3_9CEST